MTKAKAPLKREVLAAHDAWVRAVTSYGEHDMATTRALGAYQDLRKAWEEAPRPGPLRPRHSGAEMREVRIRRAIVIERRPTGRPLALWAIIEGRPRRITQLETLGPSMASEAETMCRPGGRVSAGLVDVVLAGPGGSWCIPEAQVVRRVRRARPGLTVHHCAYLSQF